MHKEAVLEWFGTASEVARALDITPQAPHAWKDLIPLDKAIRIERITKGALKVDWELYGL